MPPKSVSSSSGVPPQQILDRAQRAGDLAGEAVQDLRGLGRSVAEARAEHTLLALGALGVRGREPPVAGQRLGELPAGHAASCARRRRARRRARRASSCGVRDRPAAAGPAGRRQRRGCPAPGPRPRACAARSPPGRAAPSSSDTSLRGAIAAITSVRERSPPTISQSTTTSSRSKGSSASTSKGTAWASLRRSRKGKLRRREERRSPGSAVTTWSVARRCSPTKRCTRSASASRRPGRGRLRSCTASKPRRVCWSSTALRLWLPRSSPSTFFRTGIAHPSPDVPG